MLFRRKIHRTIIVAVFSSFLLNFSSVFALDDGFGQAKKIQGAHFMVFFAPQLDIFALSQQLNIYHSDEVLSGRRIRHSPFDTELIDKVDTLFIRVCDILDMNLYSFQGNIKICKDQSQLNKIYKTLFNKDLKGKFSFYVFDLNTIYISPEHFIREILGHEIGHAVISHYFVVLPSVKVQEVLAVYVEYQLRKIEQ